MRPRSLANDNATLHELAQALRAIARKRRSISKFLNEMAQNYEARQVAAPARVSIHRHPPHGFRET